MGLEQQAVSARDLSRHAASVLDRVEQGERLVITRDGEPIAEIIPIDRVQRLLARWVKQGALGAPPPSGYAKAADVSSAARSLSAVYEGHAATEELLAMRADERR